MENSKGELSFRIAQCRTVSEHDQRRALELPARDVHVRTNHFAAILHRGLGSAQKPARKFRMESELSEFKNAAERPHTFLDSIDGWNDLPVLGSYAHKGETLCG
jgi:hypothetical protein